MIARMKLHSGWHRWWPFATLCGLLLLRWNLVEAYPQDASTLPSEAMACGVVAATLAVWALLANVSRPPARWLVRAGVAGALLLAGPELALFFPGSHITASATVLALSLTPVAVAITVSIQGAGTGISSALLVPAIAVPSALLLLMPAPNLTSASADTILLLIPLLTAAGCVARPRRALSSRLWTATALVAGAALSFGAGLACQLLVKASATTLSVPAVAADAVLVLLAVLAASRLAPLQYAARFALMPLLALLEGWVIFRSPLTPRVACGLALLAAGTIALLRRRNLQEVDERLSLVP